jgi:hypothetical protein
MGGDPLLEALDTGEGAVPAPLECIHHEPIVRIGGIVRLPRPLGVRASGCQITL